MIKWYKKVVFENYANFNGRARRSEYWYFVLMNLIVLIVATVLDGALGLNFSPLPYGYLYAAVALATFIPGLAVAVRRLHDVGKSGWFYFIVLIPLVGAIWLLVLFFTEGQQGENQYGPDPKAEGAEINEIGNE
ncbi:DUF805 domain-containing protein [Flavobacterium sedimenticola]|uniref:DUF805 domain-containing protein n=1 Tax=Flavobacterium sedimenticola TaxID=3043286 RepID=A0ABT6XMH0_9FLAO|nr:DUF805 domain-containing protein [Flavobacterium sedimenticola]MDI9256266.1 DUF805 domain-containing protein [Flavobacterium sedimenticola]